MATTPVPSSTQSAWPDNDPFSSRLEVSVSDRSWVVVTSNRARSAAARSKVNSSLS